MLIANIAVCFQALIFCATRRMAIQSANQLVKTLGERNESYVVGGHQQKVLSTAVSKCKNQSLAELLRYGVGNETPLFRCISLDGQICNTIFARISHCRIGAL